MTTVQLVGKRVAELKAKITELETEIADLRNRMQPLVSVAEFVQYQIGGVRSTLSARNNAAAAVRRATEK